MFHLALFGYFLAYLLYWFFFATHQSRFLMPALVAALILTAILLTQIKRWKLLILSIIIIITTITLNHFTKAFYNQSAWLAFVNRKLQKTERQYALGKETKSEFLNRHFGCQYAIIETMELKGWGGTVIDNWSLWHDPSVNFYASKNAFTRFPFGSDDFNIIKDLQDRNIHYIYFNIKTKQHHLKNPDPEVIRYRTGRDRIEEFLLGHSDIIYKNRDCRLYKINFEKLAQSLK
jgi:hypothetical protein